MHALTNAVPDNPEKNTDQVFYKDSVRPVTYYESFAVDGVEYPDVFMLRPGELAEISFPNPDSVASYAIVECGVDTAVYSGVSVNGTAVTGTAGPDYPAGREDYATGYASPAERARVTYVNKVNPDALRTMTFSKKLYREDGVTELTAEDDPTPFSFRLYLGTEFEENPGAAAMHTYYIRDPKGCYCIWDTEQQAFISTEKTQYDELTGEQRAAAQFTTSLYGSVSRIPAGYTAEVRNVLAGTRFRLTERPSEMPDGYSFQKYAYNDPAWRGNTEDAATGIEDTVSTDLDPHVDVCNLKGWGLRVRKQWSDEAYMSGRDAAYFAVFTRNDDGTLTLVDAVNTVRQLLFGETSLYWYFLPLPVKVDFDRYEIREVKVDSPVVDAEGYVTSWASLEPVEDGGELQVYGTQKGETTGSAFTYTVQYERGTLQADTNIRVDTVTNNRPGIVLKKQDWNGNALPGAAFTLRDEDGNEIGSFTSDAEGLIPKVSEALPARTYYLVESEVPEGYRQPDEHVRFTISETGQVTLTENPLASLSEEAEEPDGGLVYTITVRNQPEAAALRVIKTDQGGLPLEEAVFTLTGPEEEKELVSRIPDGGKDAVIFADDNMQEGTYTLTETKAPEGYILPEDPVIIRVKKTDKGMTVTASVNGTELEYPQLEQDRDTGDWTLRIVNQGGYELPATGGPGTGMFRLAGFLLLLLAGALQLRRRADRY